MTVSLKHAFTSAKSDSADTTLVQPSNWNAEHTLTLATSRLIGRTTAGTGAAEEIAVSSDLSLSAGTLGVASSVATLTGSQVLTNKTLTNPTINGFTGDTSVVNIGSGQIYKDTSGNVGIGTSSPSYRLTIPATGTVAAYLGGIRVGANGTDIVGDIGPVSIQALGANYVGFSTNSSERMRIDSSGNVGIGTASPIAKLDVVGSINFGPSDGSKVAVGTTNTFTPSGGNPTAYYGMTFGGFVTNSISLSGYNGIAFYTNAGLERVRIDSSGNVGIGNTASNVNDQVGSVRPLLVSKSDTSTTIAGSTAGIVIGNSDTTTSNTSQLSFAALTGANSTYYTSAAINCIFGARTNGQYPTGQLVFSTSTSLNSAPTEKMRLDNSGNFLINTTSTTLYSATSGYGVCYRKNASFDVLSTSDNAIILNRTGADGSIEEFRKSGTIVGSISVTGSLTTYNVSSDYRLKNSVARMTAGLETISALKPVTYKWNTDNSYGEGFIAHELQSVIPLAVSGEKDAVNEDGSIKTQQVDYSKIVVHLVAAIQELKAELDALKGKTA
jgi:hypothetical protein